MQKSIRFMASVLILGAYLLSACTGAAPSQSSDPAKAQKVDSSEVVFTGIVEAINGDQWTVNGQTVVIDGLTALDVNIKVGDVVKVEANVSQDGSVVAVKIESSVADDTNSNSSNDNSSNANDNNANDANSNDDSNANDNGNGNTNGNDNGAVDGQDEVFGVVEAVTSDTITVDGIVYNLADFTEIKDGIVVGDLVKIHVIVNADGTLTIREIEKSTGIGGDDNSNDDDQIGNSNGNSNGDDNGDNSNGNSNDDDKDDDNSDDNSSGDDDSGNSNDNTSGNDDGGNSNSNGNDD